MSSQRKAELALGLTPRSIWRGGLEPGPDKGGNPAAEPTAHSSARDAKGDPRWSERDRDRATFVGERTGEAGPLPVVFAQSPRDGVSSSGQSSAAICVVIVSSAELISFRRSLRSVRS